METDKAGKKTAESWSPKQIAAFGDAVNVLQEGLAIFDADDRMILCNNLYYGIFPLVADLIKPGVPFEDLIYAAAKRGQNIESETNPEEWAASRIKAHREPSGKFEHNFADGRCIWVEEQKTRDGGTISTYIDVTVLKQREREVAQKSALLEVALDSMAQGIIVFDSELTILASSAKAAQLLDMDLESLREGGSVEEIIRVAAERGDYGPDDPKSYSERLISMVRSGESYDIERTLPDGKILSVRARPMPSGGAVVTYTDITERHLSEQALRASEARLANAQRLARLGSWDLDVDSGQLVGSEESFRILGVGSNEESVTLAQFFGMVHAEDRELVQHVFDRAISGKEVLSVDHRVLLPDGRQRMVHTQGELTQDDSGESARLSGTIQDVTEQKRAERALRASDARLRRQNEVLSGLAKKMALTSDDLEKSLRDITEAACRTLRTERCAIWMISDHSDHVSCIDLYELSTNRHTSGAKLITHEAPKFFTALEGQRYLALEDAENHPYTRVFADSYFIPNGISGVLAAPVYAAGHFVGLISAEHVGAPRPWTPEEQTFAAALADLASLALEANDRRRTSEQLQLTQFSIDRAGDGIFWIGPDSSFIYANETACHMLGYRLDELLALRVPDTTPDLEDKDWPKYWERLKLRGSETFESTQKAKDGRIFPVEIARNYIEFDGKEYACVFVRDISERKSSEERMSQGQKMEALGQLAGGIAHEFNNLLTSIRGFTRMAMNKPEDLERVESCLKEVAEASSRATDLTRQMLTFSHKQVLEPKVVRLGEIVRNMEKLLRAFMEESIELHIDVANGRACAEVDAARLSQAIVNLAINARHAMPDGGKLNIGCDTVNFDKTFVASHGDELSPGPYIRIYVTDEGTGIDNETMRHIFEPFFTTKGAGKGTGLGLSLVYGMIKNFGGVIHVESEVGVGTTFAIYLPVVDKEPTNESADEEEERAILGGSETILVAEDDTQVRSFVKTILEDQGYTVLTAANGKAAIQTYKEHADRINMLVTDVIMPEMGGIELAKTLTGMRSDLKIIYMTGYAPELTEGLDKVKEDITVLRKPFEPNDLGKLVREALNT